MLATATNTDIRARLRGRAEAGDWSHDPNSDLFIDYRSDWPSFEECLQVRDVDIELLEGDGGDVNLPERLMALWPYRYGNLETWDKLGGPLMDRIADLLRDCGYGHDDNRDMLPGRLEDLLAIPPEGGLPLALR